MLKVGVIGIGNIAQKAYLPVMATMHDQVEWHLFTRNQDKLAEVGKQQQFSHLHPSVDSLIDAGIDAAFVHAPTAVHFDTIKQLLEADIHVYVDKPISDQIAETEALVALAKEKNLILTCGFNRRFAPHVQALKAIPDKKMILIQKDRVQNFEDVRFAIYDLFIHILDAGLFLLDDPIESTHSTIIEKEGQLKRIVLTIQTKETTCLVAMNYEAGANQEVMEVQSLAGIQRVVDLNERHIKTPAGEQVIRFGDWENTLVKRGFDGVIREFITSLSTKLNPVSLDSALDSHRLCENLINNA